MLALIAWLLFAVGQTPSPQPWSVEQLDERCPVFRWEGAVLTTSHCEVTDWGEIGTAAGDTYYAAVYCLDRPDVPATWACDTRPQGRASAVFVKRRGQATLMLVTAKYALGGEFRRPSLVSGPFGDFIEMPMVLAATCDCNASYYYRRNRATGRWQALDFENWSIGLKLPEGLSSVNTPWPDLRTLTMTGGLWRKDDPHCCPTGGEYTVQLAIRGNRFVVQWVSIRPQSAPPAPAR